MIITAVKKCLSRIYRKGYRYHRAGLMLLDLVPETFKQFDLFDNPKKKEIVMKALDYINEKMGKGSLFIGAEGVSQPWRTKANFRSPRYTTCWDELLKVVCK